MDGGVGRAALANSLWVGELLPTACALRSPRTPFYCVLRSFLCLALTEENQSAIMLYTPSLTMVRSVRRIVTSLWLVSLITSCNAFSHPRSAILTANNAVCGSITAAGPRFATMLQSAVVKQDEVDECPPGYYLDHVKERCNKLGPLGTASQVIERAGPCKRVYRKISSLFGIDPHRISKLGVAFALSYSVISNINGSLSLSVAWYLSCTRVSTVLYTAAKLKLSKGD
jgi:hypothetical protein